MIEMPCRVPCEIWRLALPRWRALIAMLPLWAMALAWLMFAAAPRLPTGAVSRFAAICGLTGVLRGFDLVAGSSTGAQT